MLIIQIFLISYGIIYFELVINSVLFGLCNTQNDKEYSIITSQSFVYCITFSVNICISDNR